MAHFQKYLLLGFLGAALFFAGSVLALSKDDIVFPVAELGNCQDEQECKAYCSDSLHIAECIAFAEKYNLMSPQELERARQFESIGGVGPGGCTNEFECQFYCEDVSHIEECVAFAEQHGLMNAQELQEAKQVLRALQQGAQLPGGCQNEQECEQYCQESSHMAECIAFAEAAGFMPPQELREAKQVLKAIEAGVSPPNCRGQRECDVYCEQPEHMQECVEFGLAAGLIPPEEAEIVKKMLPLMKAGKVPEACMGGKKECEAYCAQEQNIDECTTFFVEAGFMTPDEAEMFKKTGGKGPGDCRSEEECDAFCNNPANQEICFEFAREHGLIPPEDLQRMEEGIGKFKEWFNTAPPEVVQCLKARVGEEVLNKIHEGTFMPNPELIGSLEQCFMAFGEKERAAFEQQARGCLGLDCENAFSCLEGLQRPQFGGGPGGPKEEGPGEAGFGEPSGIETEIQQKINSCTREFEQQAEQQFFGPEGFPQEFEQGLPPEFEGLNPEEIEQQIRQQEEQRIREQYQQGGFEQQFQEQFEQQFKEEQQRQLEQFQQLVPQVPQIQGGGPSPEEIQRIEQEEAAEVQQQQQEQQVQQQQLEQELQQQFQELEQLQQQLQEQQAPPAGSALDAFLYLLRPLLPR